MTDMKALNLIFVFMRKVNFLVVVAFTPPMMATGQSLEIVRVEQEGTRMNVYYDLVDANAANRYTLELFSSLDQFTTPLKNVSGAIGEELPPGTNKKIVFDMAAEYGDSLAVQAEGKIRFEIRGDLYVPFVVMKQSHKKLKRGRTYTFTWNVRPGSGRVTAELLRDDEVVLSASPASNDSFTMTVPSETQVGNGYSLRFRDVTNEKNVYTTSQFPVVRKVPLVAYVVPVVVVAVIVIPMLGPEPPEKLPDPALPPD